MSLGASGQVVAPSFICQGARLDGDLERVVDEGRAKNHTEFRTLDRAGRNKGDRASLDRWVSVDINSKRDWLGHAKHSEVACDPCGAGVQLLDLRRGEAECRKLLGVQERGTLNKVTEGLRAGIDRSGVNSEAREALRRTLEIDEDPAQIAGKVAPRGRKAHSVDLEANPCVRLVDARPFGLRCRIRAGKTQKRHHAQPNDATASPRKVRRHHLYERTPLHGILLGAQPLLSLRRSFSRDEVPILASSVTPPPCCGRSARQFRT
jgi:hypothetical protein